MNPVLGLSSVPSLLENDLVPGPSGGIPLRWYRPSSDARLPVTVYFHGGGWIVDDLDTHDHPCRRLARRSQAVVVSVAYRRAPPSAPKALDLAASAARRRFPYLSVLGVQDALHHQFEESPGRLGVAHGEGAEVPFGEHQAVQLRLSGDLRRTVTVGFVDECHFPEVVTGAKDANGLPVH